MLGGRRQQAFQGRVGQFSTCLQCVIEHDGEYSKQWLARAGSKMISNKNKKDATEASLD